MMAMEEVNNYGIGLYYIGHGRRNTGDWCFQDGYITFTDLAQLYLQLLRGRVLTIITDCRSQVMDKNQPRKM